MIPMPATGVPLSPDAALPSRDRLLDADHVAAHVRTLLGARGPLDVRSCRVVRAKYRLGDSLRVVYRLDLPDGERTVSVRAFADPAAAVRAARSAAAAVPAGDDAVRAAAYDAEHAAMWWTFPHDRRVAGLARLMQPSGALADLPGGRWERSVLMEYAAERSATVRAHAADGAVLGYGKAYRHPADAVAVAELYGALGAALAPAAGRARTPSVLALDAADGILVLEAMPGRRWDELDAAGSAAMLPLLGRAVAHLHGAPVPATLLPFPRFAPARIATAGRVLAEARPDAADAGLRLARRLIAGVPDDAPAVLLHGDLHPKNALLDGDRLSLIDIDQAGTGSASADVGSLVARLLYGELVGEHDRATAASHIGAVLGAYGAVRPLPSLASLRWHVAAALVVERAVRAVNRVHLGALAVLPDILTAAERCLDREELP